MKREKQRERRRDESVYYAPIRCFELENPCNYDNSAFRHPRTPEKKEKAMLTDYIENQYQSAHDPTIYSKHHERNIVVHCSRPVLSPLRCYL